MDVGSNYMLLQHILSYVVDSYRKARMRGVASLSLFSSSDFKVMSAPALTWAVQIRAKRHKFIKFLIYFILQAGSRQSLLDTKGRCQLIGVKALLSNLTFSSFYWIYIWNYLVHCTGETGLFLQYHQIKSRFLSFKVTGMTSCWAGLCQGFRSRDTGNQQDRDATNIFEDFDAFQTTLPLSKDEDSSYKNQMSFDFNRLRERSLSKRFLD